MGLWGEKSDDIVQVGVGVRVYGGGVEEQGEGGNGVRNNAVYGRLRGKRRS